MQLFKYRAPRKAEDKDAIYKIPPTENELEIRSYLKHKEEEKKHMYKSVDMIESQNHKDVKLLQKQKKEQEQLDSKLRKLENRV